MGYDDRMTFYAFGINHETASVAVREAFALDEQAQRRLSSLLRLDPSAEVILLSTCNRTEVYLFGTETDVVSVQATLSAFAGVPWPGEHAFALMDEEAVLHVLHVTSGLRSQVLGDEQILAQMKGAYRIAVDEERIGSVLHRLMHTAFRTAKRVRTETALSEGAASISGLAVRAARLHFEQQGSSLDGRRVLLLGTGEMGLVALKTLASEGAVLTVSNRSRERAEAAAESVGAELLDWSARHAAVAEADLVLVASGAPEPVLFERDLPPRTEAAPCLIIDVAMPRNVEPSIRDKAGYTLLDLDLLGLWRTQTTESRRAAAPAAEAICAEGLAEFVAWVFNHEALQPAIRALRETFEAIRQQEIERHAHRFQSADREDLDRLTRSILQKLLAVPVVRLKNTDSESLDFVRGVRFLSHAFSRPGCDQASSAEDASRPRSEAEAAGETSCPFGHEHSAGTNQEPAEGSRETRNARQ